MEAEAGAPLQPTLAPETESSAHPMHRVSECACFFPSFLRGILISPCAEFREKLKAQGEHVQGFGGKKAPTAVVRGVRACPSLLFWVVLPLPFCHREILKERKSGVCLSHAQVSQGGGEARGGQPGVPSPPPT